MARAGESCPGFTEKQRLTLLYNANIAPSASIHDTRSYYEYYHNEVVLSDDGSSMASSCSTSSSTFSLSFAEVAAQTNIAADH
jgi:hypothetical protein